MIHALIVHTGAHSIVPCGSALVVYYEYFEHFSFFFLYSIFLLDYLFIYFHERLHRPTD
jgi:hypothetical protein